MYKRLLLAFFLITVPILGFSQYYLRIDSLMVYNIVETEDEYVIDEGFGEGPYVYGYFTLCNNTDKVLSIQSSDLYMRFYYEFGGEKKSSVYLHCTEYKDLLTINPMDSISFKCGAMLMIDVDLHKSTRYVSQSMKIIDHSEIFKFILPSFYAGIETNGDYVLRTPTYMWNFVDYIEIGESDYIIAYPVCEVNKN